MPLLIEGRLEELGAKMPEGAGDLPLGFRIPGEVLSKPYGLREGDILVGRLLEVYELRHGLPRSDEALKELWSSEVKFVLRPLLSGDYLFLHRDTWHLLRDYGVAVPGRYALKVMLVKAIRSRTGEEVEIYPRRTVVP